MSPLSVAQYLPSDHAHFDMIIFDEASQITTWDAVGAIARGTQSIIVGDPKQLPPTNFFGRTDDDEEAELELYEKDLPSILDEAAAAGLPTHQLNWHYRSRDEALIAFSNYHYYDSRLVTFPSPTTGSNALVLHRVAGVYARGAGRTNAVEARAVVDLIVSRLRQWLILPEEQRLTLGVITFNAQQQELILDLLDAARRDAPELEWFFEDEREEPLIVKNLENIQGDERDVMLFSITFGPDQAGKIAMNFGAVNGDGGEKRLNVAVTRARAELHVFASLSADQIDLDRTKALGVAHLKNFLDYAARGEVALPAMDSGSLGPAESVFEEAVADALRARGWEVRTQIGVSGFRIDLGVVHSDRAGAFLAGIECDGATYHSSASARDRDRIREDVLRNLGWQILRVWSTDWFRQPRDACERIDASLHHLLDASRAQAQAEQPVKQIDDASPSAAHEPATEVPHEHPMDLDAETVVAPNDGGSRGHIANSSMDRPKTDEGSTHPDQMPQVPEALVASEVSATKELPGENNHVRGVVTGDALSDQISTTEATVSAQLPTPDPDQFHEPDYTSTLKTIVAHIIEREGPIRDDLLARRICREHGWQRAGRRIRERVLQCLGDNEIHADGDRAFIWAPGTHAPRIAFRHGLERTLWDVPTAEIAGLIAEHPELQRHEDAPRELARLMGIARVTDEARSHLERCLSGYRREQSGFD
jgi:very-short-patch-repair endonuclease